MKNRIPRKLKKKIPKGVYCYSPVEFPCKENNWVYKIKECSYYTSIKIKNVPKNSTDEVMKEMSEEGEFPEEFVGWCRKINYSIDDQCKSCGFNKPNW